MSNSIKGIIYAGLAACCWGTYGTMCTLLYGHGFSDTAIAAFPPIAMFIFFLASALIRNPKGIIPTKKAFIALIVIGIVGVAGTNIFYAKAMAEGLSVGIASVITFSNYFVVMIISRIVWKIKITKAKVISGLFCVLGICLLLQIWLDLSASLTGIIFVFIVMLTFAISYSLQNFCINDEGMDPDGYYVWVELFGIISIFLINPPWNIFNEVTASYATYGANTIIILLIYCIITNIGCYYCTGRAFLYTDPPTVTIMFSLDPLVATVLGFIVLGQTLSIIQLLGMAVIIGSLIVLQVTERKQMQQAEFPKISNS